MNFQGGDTEGLRHLRRELQLAGAGLARSRASVERLMNEVCMTTTVPAELRRVEASVDETAAMVDRAVAALEEPERPAPSPGTISGFPNGVEGDCGRMEQGIGATVDVLIGRVHDLRADVNNLRELRPDGPNSFKGHLEQAKGRQRQIDKQLTTWKNHGGCPGSLTVEVARAYAALDIEADLGWSVATVEAARAAAVAKKDWWDVDVDLEPLVTMGKVAAVAAAVAAAAAAAASSSVRSAGLA